MPPRRVVRVDDVCSRPRVFDVASDERVVTCLSSASSNLVQNRLWRRFLKFLAVSNDETTLFCPGVLGEFAVLLAAPRTFAAVLSRLRPPLHLLRQLHQIVVPAARRASTKSAVRDSGKLTDAQRPLRSLLRGAMTGSYPYFFKNYYAWEIPLRYREIAETIPA